MINIPTRSSICLDNIFINFQNSSISSSIIHLSTSEHLGQQIVFEMSLKFNKFELDQLQLQE